MPEPISSTPQPTSSYKEQKIPIKYPNTWQRNKWISMFVTALLMILVFGSAAYVAYHGEQQKQLAKYIDVEPEATIILPKGISTSPAPNTPESKNCDCSWAITGSTNVEFLITDPYGKQTGYLKDLKTYAREIPDSSYGIESGMADDLGQNPPQPDIQYFGMNNADNGVYKLEVIGRENGSYHIEIAIVWGPMNTKSILFDGDLDVNQVDSYQIMFPSGTIQKLNK